MTKGRPIHSTRTQAQTHDAGPSRPHRDDPPIRRAIQAPHPYPSRRRAQNPRQDHSCHHGLRIAIRRGCDKVASHRAVRVHDRLARRVRLRHIQEGPVPRQGPRHPRGMRRQARAHRHRQVRPLLRATRGVPQSRGHRCSRLPLPGRRAHDRDRRGRDRPRVQQQLRLRHRHRRRHTRGHRQVRSRRAHQRRTQPGPLRFSRSRRPSAAVDDSMRTLRRGANHRGTRRGGHQEQRAGSRRSESVHAAPVHAPGARRRR